MLSARALKKGFAFSLLAMTLALAGCNGSSSSSASAIEDSSASGAAGAVVGSAVANSSQSGTVSSNDRIVGKSSLFAFLGAEKPAWAASVCPTFLTANGSGCTNATPVANEVALTQSSCSYGSTLSVWSGIIAVGMSSGSVICGTFPTVTNRTLYRYYSTLANAASSGTRVSSFGTTVTLDDATANLGLFDTGTTVAGSITPSSSGYGTSVTFNASSLRTGVSIYRHLTATASGSTKWNHSVAGSLAISESAGSRVATGSLTVYHNLLQIVGTSTFTGVTMNDSCCSPVAGSISTSFAAGAHVAPTSIGSLVIGKSESLSFSSTCGTGTFTDVNGSVSTVALGCY